MARAWSIYRYNMARVWTSLIRYATYSWLGGSRVHDVKVLSRGNHPFCGLKGAIMEEESKLVSRLQKEVARCVVIKQHSHLVGHVNAIRIFPHLVSSQVFEPDFRQELDYERTDKDKMMLLLRELIRNPMEGWFKEFVGALSKFPHYQSVVDSLLEGSYV